MKRAIFSGVWCLFVVLVAGCNTNVKRGGVENTVTGSAGTSPDSAQEQSLELTRCTKPLGVAALVEPESSGSPYAVLTQRNLPSPIPMLKLMMAQSGCFQVVDRGAGSKALERERALASAGELRSEENTSKGQMVSADWVITPNVIFQDSNAGGTNVAAGALLGSFIPFGGLLGAVKVTDQEAQTLLTAVSVKTGLQEAVAEGNAQKKDVGFGVGGFGSSLAGGGGSYASTDIGKLVTIAFMDAHNKLVSALQDNGS